MKKEVKKNGKENKKKVPKATGNPRQVTSR